MSFYTQPLARLIDEFQKLPGIGPKSAQRLAFHILKQPSEHVAAFSHALTHAKATIHQCTVCYNFASESPCELCQNPERDVRILGLVADSEDLYALERTGEFAGHYHVLHGLISPMDGIGPDDLKIRELLARLSETSTVPPPDEVILALPPSIEGDTTSLYLSKLIKPLGIKVSRIAFGLPVGGDLEYADNMTIVRALQGRQEL